MVSGGWGGERMTAPSGVNVAIMHDFRCHVVNCGFHGTANDFWVVCSCGWFQGGLFMGEVMNEYDKHKDTPHV